MFRAENGIIIPQFEHGRLAGDLASAWGNSDFQRPQIDSDSFNLGNYFHDRGFGVGADNYPIGEMDPQEHLRILEDGFFKMSFANITADIVAKKHIRRLTTMRNDPKAQALLARMNEEIDRLFYANQELSKEAFAWADLITEACDDISFYWCDGRKFTYEVDVLQTHQSTEPTTIKYRVHRQPGLIEVSPWPFSKESFSGTIFGYGAEGYANKLEPEAISYTVTKWEAV